MMVEGVYMEQAAHIGQPFVEVAHIGQPEQVVDNRLDMVARVGQPE